MDSFTTTNSPAAAGEQHKHSAPGCPRVCGEPAVLPTDLVFTALRYTDRPGIELVDIREVRCTLEAHPTGDHYAFIVETSSTTSAWTRWSRGAGPRVVLVLPDCPATGSGNEACSEYEHHRGGHTWQVDDPCGRDGFAK